MAEKEGKKPQRELPGFEIPRQQAGKGKEKAGAPEGGKFRTLAKGTTFFSGVYPHAGEIIGYAEKSIKTVVFEGEMRRGQDQTASWLFFPTNHSVEIGRGREINAWVAKIPGEAGYVKI